MGVLLNYPKFSASNDSGTALVGGELYTYIAGTTTNKATYSDYNLATANANPVVLDRRGEATVYGAGVYKFVLKDSAGNTVWSVDNLTLAIEQGDYAFYPDPDEADQNAVSTGGSIRDILTALGTSKKATIILYHSGAANTTTYTNASDADWSAYTNVTFRIVHGAILQIATGTTTTFGGPLEAGLYQVFNCLGTGKVTGLKTIRPQYWGAKGDWVADVDAVSPHGSGTDDTTAIQQLFDSFVLPTTHPITTVSGINSVANAMSSKANVIFPRGLYKTSSPLKFGEAGKFINHVNITFEGSAIYADLAAYSATIPELVLNGLSWAGATGATPPTSWAVYNAGIFTALADSGPGGAGDTCLKIEVNAGPTANPGIKQSFATTIGKIYQFSIDHKNGTAGDGYVILGVAYGSPDYGILEYKGNSVWTTYPFRFVATTTTTYLTVQTISSVAGQYDLFDNVSLTELPDPALTITNIRFSELEGINVYAHNGSGIRFDTINFCTIKNLSSGSGGVLGSKDIDLMGWNFGNSWTNTRMAQSHGYNGSGYYNFYADSSFARPDEATPNFVNNNFDGFFAASAKTNFIYIKNANNVTFNNLEIEGGTLKTGVFVENSVKVGFHYSYSELAAVGGFVYYFKNSSHITLSNVLGSSYYNYLKFEETDFITIKDSDDGGPPKLVGTCNYITIDNCRFRVSTPNQFLDGPDAAPYTSADHFNITNVKLINTVTTDIKGIFNKIQSGELDTHDNMILNPAAVDAAGNIVTTYCATTIDAGYTAVSPLGYRETLVEIDSAAGWPRFVLDLDTTKLTKKTTAGVLLLAWKKTAVAGSSGVIGSSGPTSHGVYQSSYGEFFVQQGDWLITATTVNIDSADTTMTVAWSYDDSFVIGDKYLFGGAALYQGHNIKLP